MCCMCDRCYNCDVGRKLYFMIIGRYDNPIQTQIANAYKIGISHLSWCIIIWLMWGVPIAVFASFRCFAISGMDMADCRSGTFNICNNGNIPQDFQKDRDQGII